MTDGNKFQNLKFPFHQAVWDGGIFISSGGHISVGVYF